MSDLVENPEDRFSKNEAHIVILTIVTVLFYNIPLAKGPKKMSAFRAICPPPHQVINHRPFKSGSFAVPVSLTFILLYVHIILIRLR